MTQDKPADTIDKAIILVIGLIVLVVAGVFIYYKYAKTKRRKEKLQAKKTLIETEGELAITEERQNKLRKRLQIIEAKIKLLDKEQERLDTSRKNFHKALEGVQKWSDLEIQ